MVELGRLLTAMITPFDEEGEIDYGQARKLGNRPGQLRQRRAGDRRHDRRVSIDVGGREAPDLRRGQRGGR